MAVGGSRPWQHRRSTPMSCVSAVRLYRESYPKPVIRRLAEQLGVHHEELRNWIRQAEADTGERHDWPTSEMVQENRRMRREATELRRANEILRTRARASRRSCAPHSADSFGGGQPRGPVTSTGSHHRAGSGQRLHPVTRRPLGRRRPGRRISGVPRLGLASRSGRLSSVVG